jgi:hypothetical protein
LRALDGTPIKAENHFIIERNCEDCIPYLVVNTKDRGGLRTSHTLQIKSEVKITAYFADTKQDQALTFKSIIHEWMKSAGCLDLGECGCFCVDSVPEISLASSAGSKIRMSLGFSGTYQPAEVESLSASV